MNPEHIIAQWHNNLLTERDGAQPFIEDLCALLRLDKPRNSEEFCYEKGAHKDGGWQGLADVWSDYSPDMTDAEILRPQC